MEGFPSRAKLLDLVREGVLGFPNSSASRWVAQVCDVLRKLAYEQPEVPEQPKVETLQEVSVRLHKRATPFREDIGDTAGIVLRQHLRLLKVLGFGWPGMPDAEREDIRRQIRHVEQMLEGCEP